MGSPGVCPNSLLVLLCFCAEVPSIVAAATLRHFPFPVFYVSRRISFGGLLSYSVWGNSGSEGRGGGAGAFNPLPSALSNGHKFMIGRKERGNGGEGAYLETEAAMNASIAIGKRRHNLGGGKSGGRG